MSNHICTECRRPIRNELPVLRGNGRTVSAWHRDCAILAGIVEATLRQTVDAALEPFRSAS